MTKWSTNTEAVTWTIRLTNDPREHGRYAGSIFNDVSSNTFTAHPTGPAHPRDFKSLSSATRYLRNTLLKAMDENALDRTRLNNGFVGAVDVTDWTDEDLADDYFDNA